MFELWEKQKITAADLIVVKQRIFDQATQYIFSQLDISSKCSFFKYLIATHDLQFYLRKPIPNKYQKCISRFRLSSHQLSIETGRFYNIERHNRKCFLCSNSIEDEFQFILICPIYEGYRKKYIKPYYWKKPSMCKLLQLFHVENVKELCNLGKFIHFSLKIRQDLLNAN